LLVVFHVSLAYIPVGMTMDEYRRNLTSFCIVLHFQMGCSRWIVRLPDVRFLNLILAGAAPDPSGGAYSAPSDSQLHLRGPTPKRMGVGGAGK